MNTRPVIFRRPPTSRSPTATCSCRSPAQVAGGGSRGATIGLMTARCPLRLLSFVVAALLCASCSGAKQVPDRTEWHLDPNAPGVVPSTRSLRVLAADVECASGRSQDSLIRDAVITYLKTDIDIHFLTAPLSGFRECPRPLPFWATRTVALAEPVGNRRLVDTGLGSPGQVRYPNDTCPVTADSEGCPAPQPAGPPHGPFG